MNRIYLMPKIIILMFIFLYIFETITWTNIILTLIVSALLVIIYQVLKITLIGKYYLYLINKGKIVPMEKIYRIVNHYIKLVNLILRINITYKHYERVNPNKNYLVTPNHQSNADPLIILEVFNTPITFVAKIAVSRIILVKDWMKLLGSLYLDKNDMRSQINIMKNVEEKIKNNESVLIFPEGKRSFSPVMNEFKPGTFKMATKTKVDILPITINHVHKFRNHFPWRKTNIDVYIHEPIPYETYKDMSTQEIAIMVQNIIESEINYENCHDSFSQQLIK